MPPEKRNNYLDADESDEDGNGFESEEELQKGGGRSAKRRKVEDDDDLDNEISDDEDAASVNGQVEGLDDDLAASEHDDVEDTEGGTSANKDAPNRKTVDDLPGVSRPLSKKNLVATEAAVKKSGVVYLSRIPPFMKPQKLRSLLEPYGTINRIFLSPEDPLAHSRRVRNGGNKKRSFTDGWVEFVKKNDAKNAVDLLNGRTIGGKKGTYYRDDIWTILYLKGFKWNNLTEQISAEAAERTSRMRAEISKSTKENKEFVRNVEKGKMLDGIQSKATAKNKERTDGLDTKKSRRKFEQASVVKKGSDVLPEESHRVSRMLFS